MSYAHRAMVLFALGTLAGCSLAFGDNLDKQQCDKPADCGNAPNGVPYLCVENVCQEDVNGCLVDSDCKLADQMTADPARRCGYDNKCYSKWDCTGANDFAVTPPGNFSVQTKIVDIFDLTSNNPLPAFEATACANTDANCDRPVVTTAQTSYDTKKRVITIPFSNLSTPFSGTVKISQKGGTTYSPTYMVVPSKSPWSLEYITRTPTFVGTPVEFASLGQFVMVDEKEGTVRQSFQFFDCGGRPANNITVITKPVNGRNPAPDLQFLPVDSGNVPQQGLTSTTEEGRGFAFNVPPGSLLAFTVQDTGLNNLEVEPALSYIVKADGISFVTYFPTQASVQKYMASNTVPKFETVPAEL